MPKSHKSYNLTRNNIRAAMADVEKNLSAALQEIGLASKEGLDQVAQELYDKSTQIAPKDTRELVDSAYKTSIETSNGYMVEVGYTADHAVFSHENSNRNHDYINPTTPGTHWQYLLTPVTELEKSIANKVADNIKKVIE